MKITKKTIQTSSVTMNSHSSDKLSAIVVSDIHLGHKNNLTSRIISNLNEFLFNDEVLKDTDIVFIAGDLFDRLLEYPEECISHITVWINHVLHTCLKNNVILRILEGTPSHDWKQSEIFNAFQKRFSDLDFKYVNTLSVEYIEKFGINVLYIPDEWDLPENTLSQVKTLLSAKGLSKVDLGIFHGNFTYQLPAHITKIPRHNEQEYIPLVKYYIAIGHIHTFSQYENIIAQGSFDRLTHGQEEPKGYVKMNIDFKTENKEFFFIENTKAKIFKTIDITNRDLDTSLAYIKQQCQQLPTDSCIRLRADKEHLIFSDMSTVMSMFPTFTWTKIINTKEQIDNQITQVDIQDTYTPIIINKENIEQQLLDRMSQKQIDSTMFDIVKQNLKQILSEV